MFKMKQKSGGYLQIVLWSGENQKEEEWQLGDEKTDKITSNG